MSNPSIGYMTTGEGSRIRYGSWRSENRAHRGTVLLLSGRSEFLEKYFETVGELIQRGYDVHSFDWRGQGLSTRMLANRHKGFVRTYDDYLADLSHFVQTVMVPRGKPPFNLLAHSMGAHIGLRYLHDFPGIFDRAVLTAPMVDIARSNFLKIALRIYIRFAAVLGLGVRYVPGSCDHRPEGRKFKGNRLTSDRDRFERMNRQLRENPDLALGGITHRWLLETFRSIELITAHGFAEKITIPVLIVSAEKDLIVSKEAQKKICRRLPACSMVTLSGSLHEILIEADEVRNGFWKEFDQFVDLSK